MLTGHDVEDERLPCPAAVVLYLHARFETGDFATGIRLLDDIVETAAETNHHPDPHDAPRPRWHLDPRVPPETVDVPAGQSMRQLAEPLHTGCPTRARTT